MRLMTFRINFECVCHRIFALSQRFNWNFTFDFGTKQERNPRSYHRVRWNWLVFVRHLFYVEVSDIEFIVISRAGFSCYTRLEYFFRIFSPFCVAALTNGRRTLSLHFSDKLIIIAHFKFQAGILHQFTT